jgi:hypothetical protein
MRRWLLIWPALLPFVLFLSGVNFHLSCGLHKFQVGMVRNRYQFITWINGPDSEAWIGCGSWTSGVYVRSGSWTWRR